MPICLDEEESRLLLKGKRKLTLCLQFIVFLFLCVPLPKPPVEMFSVESFPLNRPRLRILGWLPGSAGEQEVGAGSAGPVTVRSQV